MFKMIEKDLNIQRVTVINDQDKLFKRARAKFFTRSLILKLVQLDSILKKQYWNTYYCSDVLIRQGTKISSKYCKNRFCMVCNRIRTAVNINNYYDELKNWDDKYFVTLTIPNVKGSDLSSGIDMMLENFTKIRRVIKYNRKLSFVGIRKLEVTYNPIRDDYHPHFHCIVRNKEVANILVDEWLKRYSFANIQCQDIRECDNHSMIELFKYFTKIISSKSAVIGDEFPVEYRRKIYINALDVIFIAVAGRRTFQNFGFKAKITDEEQIEEIEADLDGKIDFYGWIHELSDWVNESTGEILTGYSPSSSLVRIIEDIN